VVDKSASLVVSPKNERSKQQQTSATTKGGIKVAKQAPHQFWSAGPSKEPPQEIYLWKRAAAAAKGDPQKHSVYKTVQGQNINTMEIIIFLI